MNLSSRQLATDDTNSLYPIQLNVTKKLLLGLELGLERKIFNYNLVRGWLSYSKMYDPKSAVSSAYSSVKTGLDLYWDLYQFKSTRLKLLTFGLAEFDSLKGVLAFDESIKDAKGQTFPISYNLYYVGAGLTLAW